MSKTTICEYHRPKTIEEALALLSRPEQHTIPLAGGTTVNRARAEAVDVVDLQALGLDGLLPRSAYLEAGAMLTLQSLLEYLEAESNDRLSGLAALKRVIQLEATYNLRQAATVAGTLVAASGRSPFAIALLALDIRLSLLPDNEQISLGDLLPLRRERLRGRLITQLSIPLNARLAYEYVARTPADQPIVGVAAAVWPSGRTRVALGGYGAEQNFKRSLERSDSPCLAFDGTEAEGAVPAARNAFAEAGDEWASAEYRQEMAGILTQRCLDSLLGGN
jgi:CO/xanthine dehydrogenase FAD-binding subunit